MRIQRSKWHCPILKYRFPVAIGVDLAGILGDARRAPKEGRCQVRRGMWRVSPLQLTRGLGGVESSSSGVRAENGFWRILKATERSFLYLYVRNLRGQFALASPLLQILGTCPPSPRDLRPCGWLLCVCQNSFITRGVQATNKKRRCSRRFLKTSRRDCASCNCTCATLLFYSAPSPYLAIVTVAL